MCAGLKILCFNKDLDSVPSATSVVKYHTEMNYNLPHLVFHYRFGLFITKW